MAEFGSDHQRINDADLGRLHPRGPAGGSARDLMLRFMREGVQLRRGLNRASLPELCTVEGVDHESVLLRISDFDSSTLHPGAEILLNAALDGEPLFLTSEVISADEKHVRMRTPRRVYRSERRDRLRHIPDQSSGPWRLLSRIADDQVPGEVADYSSDGIGVVVPGQPSWRLGETGIVSFLTGFDAGSSTFVEVRNARPADRRPGWTRFGLRRSQSSFRPPLEVDVRERIVSRPPLQRVAHAVRLTGGALRASWQSRQRRKTRREPELDVGLATYTNSAGEELRALLMRAVGEGPPAAVVIPPAWGKTKETLLPLAATIVATFQRAGRPVTVIRFDGVRKRGESHNDVSCRESGREQHHFTFSQGVRDVSATLDFLDREIRPQRTVLVTFSAAAIEGRRATMLEQARLGGWISVVGAPDLQSAMRVVSGGVDYLGGFERGVRFGFQEIQGVEVDMDRAAQDALEHRLAFLEDARRDMAAIEIPITWVHGRFDAWMDLERARDVLSSGNSANRRLLVVPTGHQLRSSREALDVFQLIAAEACRLCFGREVVPQLPDLVEVGRRAGAERRRLKGSATSLRDFWQDYLLGRDRRVGIELMTSTSAYAELMQLQADELRIHPDFAVVDLGSGTGALIRALTEGIAPLDRVTITEIDCVGAALVRVREDYSVEVAKKGGRLSCVVADLDSTWSRVPISDSSQDAVLASLVVSYVKRPELLLNEAMRVLRPGGRIVVSTLKPDADTSALVTHGIAELRQGKGSARIAGLSDVDLEITLRGFINDAARLLDLEEQGVFRFWDRDELRSLLELAGFEEVRVVRAYGSPPQAFVAIGVRPRKESAAQGQ